jgi:superfamily II DNA or RNA helicase
MLTNYSLEIQEFVKNVEYKEDDWLNQEQRIVHDVFVYKNKRGLLAYWKPGSGKTHLTAACALSLDLPVLWITNKSLMADTNEKTNTIKRQLEEKGVDSSKLKEFKFLSLNAGNLKKQANSITFDGSFDNHFIVVDEAHHFFNSIANNSKNATDLFLKIKHARNIRILFLTGTPIIKNLFEMVPCFNMLSGFELLPESIDEFEQLFYKDGQLTRENKLENRLMGLISYYELSGYGKRKIAKGIARGNNHCGDELLSIRPIYKR